MGTFYSSVGWSYLNLILGIPFTWGGMAIFIVGLGTTPSNDCTRCDAVMVGNNYDKEHIDVDCVIGFKQIIEGSDAVIDVFFKTNSNLNYGSVSILGLSGDNNNTNNVHFDLDVSKTTYTDADLTKRVSTNSISNIGIPSIFNNHYSKDTTFGHSLFSRVRPYTNGANKFVIRFTPQASNASISTFLVTRANMLYLSGLADSLMLIYGSKLTKLHAYTDVGGQNNINNYSIYVPESNKYIDFKVANIHDHVALIGMSTNLWLVQQVDWYDDP